MLDFLLRVSVTTRFKQGVYGNCYLKIVVNIACVMLPDNSSGEDC